VRIPLYRENEMPMDTEYFTHNLMRYLKDELGVTSKVAPRGLGECVLIIGEEKNGIMKKYLLTAICISLIYHTAEAQDCSMALAPVADTEFTGIPASAVSFLESKRTRIITENGDYVGYDNGSTTAATNT
jgi:hypothetical protein